MFCPQRGKCLLFRKLYHGAILASCKVSARLSDPVKWIAEKEEEEEGVIGRREMQKQSTAIFRTVEEDCSFILAKNWWQISASFPVPLIGALLRETRCECVYCRFYSAIEATEFPAKSCLELLLLLNSRVVNPEIETRAAQVEKEGLTHFCAKTQITCCCSC